jgi:hypothetical protein
MPECDDEICSNNVCFELQADIQKRDRIINVNRNWFIENIFSTEIFKNAVIKIKKAFSFGESFFKKTKYINNPGFGLD